MYRSQLLGFDGCGENKVNSRLHVVSSLSLWDFNCQRALIFGRLKFTFEENSPGGVFTYLP